MRLAARAVYLVLFAAFLTLTFIGTFAKSALPGARHFALIPFVAIAVGTAIWPNDLARQQRRFYEKQSWWNPEHEWLASAGLYRGLALVLAVFGIGIFIGTSY